MEENIVPTVPDKQIQDLLSLADPRLPRTGSEQFLTVRNRAVMYMFIETSGRLNKITSVELVDATYEEGKIRVISKNRRERYMPIERTAQWTLDACFRARQQLDSYPDDLWLSYGGEAMQKNWLYLMIKRLGREQM